jgi:colanic acid/amylovoran biosynthesis protein
LRFSKRILLRNNIAYLLFLSVLHRVLGNTCGRRIIDTNHWLKLICEADMAVAVSGGDSFSDIYGMARFFYVALPQLLVIMLDRKLLLLPQTIGPFNGASSRLLARFIMSRAERLYSRDLEGASQTKIMLRLKQDDSRVRFCNDMGFVLEARRPQFVDMTAFQRRSQTGCPIIGLNVSGLLYIGGYNRQNMFRLKVDYRELIERVISFLISTKGARVLLIPHVVGDTDESDTLATDAVYERLRGIYRNHLFSIRGSYDQSEIKYLIGLCDSFIGSRMHACIAALSQMVPTVGIAYSEKFLGVFESIGVGDLVVDLRRLTIEEALSIIDKTLAGRKAIKSRLEITIPVVREQVINVLSDCG